MGFDDLSQAGNLIVFTLFTDYYMDTDIGEDFAWLPHRGRG
jgi:hypothetical protein